MEINLRGGKYKKVLDYHIMGIPCKIGVVDYHYQPAFKGSPRLCWSNLDYYGYTEIEYLVLDRKGYKADWLARKIDEDIDSEIQQFIKESYD
jgi:hypothetical protein